jgi:hypothetical protein
MLKWVILVVGAAAAAFGIKKLMSSNEPQIDEFAPMDSYTPTETPAV